MSLTPREVLRTPALLAARPASDRRSVRITDVILDIDRLYKWDESNGDTWDPFWADDGALYAFNCDGRGFGKAPRNLALNRLSGDSPTTLAGAMVNTMDEYGKSNQKEADNATWKACGQECIDSVFYCFVSRNVYGGESGDYWLRQTAFNSSLIKSVDRGRTWTRSAAENYGRPMWPGPAFGAPFFIHYGQNGGAVSQDGADRYVFAVSTNGFWNDGDSYILGRVPRSKLPDLDSTDWTYFGGGDGMAAGNWSRDIRKAKPVFEQRTHCGQSGPTYVPALGLYVMVAWYNTESMAKWYEPNEMRYDFYQAAHPWGPWTFVRSYSDGFLAAGEHMYGPSLCAKFQRTRGSDVELTMFTSGCPFEDLPGGMYKAWSIPVVLRTTPVASSREIGCDDPRVVHKGEWPAAGRSRESRVAGATAELRFEGVGVDFVSDKDAKLGSVDIFVDGTLARTASLATVNLPRLSGVTVFRSGALRRGTHSVRVVSRGGGPVVVGGFRVYQ